MTINIEWVDELPAPRRESRNGGLYAEFTEELKANPGAWAKWPRPLSGSTAYSLASSIRTKKTPGCPKAFQEGKWEAAARSKQLFVRYIGPE